MILLTFESVDEILKCGSVCLYTIQGDSSKQLPNLDENSVTNQINILQCAVFYFHVVLSFFLFFFLFFFNNLQSEIGNIFFQL